MSKEDWELAALTKEPFMVYYGKDEDITSLVERLAVSNFEPVKEE
jgi:hypothetical protein